MAPQVLFCFVLFSFLFFGLRKKKTSMRLRIDKKKGSKFGRYIVPVSQPLIWRKFGR